MLKRMMTVLIGLLFFSTSAIAAPFLVCDDPPVEEEVTGYVLSIDGGPEIETLAPLHYNLADIPEGMHNIEIQAQNIYGMSLPVPFSFTKGFPSAVSGITIVSD